MRQWVKECQKIVQVTGGCVLALCLCFHYCLENEEWPKNLHEINEDFQMLDLDMVPPERCDDWQVV